MHRTLRDFIEALDRAGELVRIAAPVSPILEISAIADRVARMPAPSVGATGRAVDPDHADLGGPALLFENVEGSSIPVAINVFGSYRRMEMALGVAEHGLPARAKRKPRLSHGLEAHAPSDAGFESIAARIAELVQPEPPSGLGDLLRKARRMLPLLRTPPRVVRRGICQEVVRNGDAVDLFELPIIKCWPLDGDLASVGYPTPPDQPDTSPGQGRFITFAGMFTIHADDAGKARPPSRNIGMYRAQLIDRRRLVMHWHLHHDGARHWRSWKRLGKPMPIAIAFGGESVLPYAATCPLPPGVSELLMAGFLNRGPIPLVKCRTVPLHVPANAEIVIEGWVSTEAGEPGWGSGVRGQGSGVEPRHSGAWDPPSHLLNPSPPHASVSEPIGPGAALEGPFGDHTGFYSLPDRYPIVEVSAITHRRHPIFPATIVGPPPQEDYYLGKATERIMLPLLRILIPDILDYDLPMFGAFHNCAFVKIRKEYALQARRVMHAIWGAGQMAWTKIIVVVDEDVDVHRRDEVLSAIFRHAHFGRDIEIVNGPLDILDHAAPRLGAGHKLGIDATRKIRGEEVGGIAVEVGREFGDESELAGQASPPCENVSGVEGVAEAVTPEFGRGRCAFVRLASEAALRGREVLERVMSAIAKPQAAVGKIAKRQAAFIIMVDHDIDIHDVDKVLFNWCANMDPGRDMVRNGSAVGFDATTKTPGTSINGHPVRDWPPPMRMSDEIIGRLERRWREYGLPDA